MPGAGPENSIVPRYITGPVSEKGPSSKDGWIGDRRLRMTDFVKCAKIAARIVL
jgi:hypothetical protein